jgi:hypothetical protein
MMVMKKYIVLGVILLNALWSLSASTWNSADVTLIYNYCNDQESRAADLVPQRLLSLVEGTPTTTFPLASSSDNKVYNVAFNVAFFSALPILPLEHLKETVIDKLDLNEFATFRVHNDQEEITTSEILLSALNKATLTVTYNPKDNTPEKIQKRRINWIIQKITNVAESSVWERRADREMLRKTLAKNYFDANGNPKSTEELETIGRAALAS